MSCGANWGPKKVVEGSKAHGPTVLGVIALPRPLLKRLRVVLTVAGQHQFFGLLCRSVGWWATTAVVLLS